MKFTTFYLFVVLVLVACQPKVTSVRSDIPMEEPIHWSEINLDDEDEKVFRVMVHVFNRTDGSGNFQQANPDHSWYIRHQIEEANKRLAALKPHVPEHIENPTDSKIRLELHAIRYWSDDTAYACKTHGDYTHTELFDEFITNNEFLKDEEKNYYLHFLLPGTKPRAYGGRNLVGLGFMVNAIYYEGWYDVMMKNLGGNVPANIVHELGHGMGLPHYEVQGFPCYNCEPGYDCPQEDCNNFMMRSGSSFGTSFSTCQLQVAHYLLRYGPKGSGLFSKSARAHELITTFPIPTN